MISAIVAVDNNWGIGYKGNLLESIPNDLKHFKEITTNGIVIMGRKTWDSLPKKPLPNRMNIVITSKPIGKSNGAYFWSLEQTIGFIQLHHEEREIFIIGGGQIYEKLFPFCRKVYLTKILKEYKDVDTYFPPLDNACWSLMEESEIFTHNNDISYQFLTYRRKFDIFK